MPSIVNHHGKPVVRARVIVRGITRTKKFPDDSRKSYREAVIWEEATREAIHRELDDAQRINTELLLIDQWADEYLDDVAVRFVKKTYQQKKFSFDLLTGFDQITPETTISEITPEIVSKLMQAIKTHRSGYSANKVRKNLARAWAWGSETWRQSWPPGPNPFLSIPKMPEERAPRYVPPLSDFWKVHAAAATLQDQTILCTFLQTAGRRGEIWRLKISDLDFREETVRLWTRKRAGGTLEYDIIPMTGTLKKALLTWLEHRMSAPGVIDPEHVFICLDESPFTDQYYGKPFTQRRHVMGKLCKKAGVKPFGWHAIRHLTATQLYLEKVPIKDIQLILRHRSATTTDRYLKSLGLITEMARNALDKIGSGPAEIIPFKTEKGPDRGSQK